MDTSVYFIFWTLIGYIIQVIVVGITVTQYLSASFIGTIATLLLVRVYTKFLDYIRYKLDTHFGYVETTVKIIDVKQIISIAEKVREIPKKVVLPRKVKKMKK